MSMLIALAATLLTAAACFAAVMILARGRHSVHDRLAELNLSDITDRKSSGEDLFYRLLADDQRSMLLRRLQEAGWNDIAPQQMVFRSVIAAVVGAAIGVALMFILAEFDAMTIGATIVLIICGAAAPNFLLNSAIEKRKRELYRELPDFLDMVATTVEAGIALNGAMAVAVDALSGPLRDEFQIVLSDIRLGRSRVEALAAFAKRAHQIDITTTVTAIVQAERLGGNIVSVLDELAKDARDKRLMRAEELAAQLPVKMVFPMVLCMLPALLLIIFGAIVADFLNK